MTYISEIEGEVNSLPPLGETINISRTKRIYNKPGPFFEHPYWQMIRNVCKPCKNKRCGWGNERRCLFVKRNRGPWNTKQEFMKYVRLGDCWMSRTRRFYNKPNNYLYWHPWHVLCMGNCRSCKSRRRNNLKTRGWSWSDKKVLNTEFKKWGLTNS